MRIRLLIESSDTTLFCISNFVGYTLQTSKPVLHSSVFVLFSIAFCVLFCFALPSKYSFQRVMCMVVCAMLNIKLQFINLWMKTDDFPVCPPHIFSISYIFICVNYSHANITWRPHYLVMQAFILYALNKCQRLKQNKIFAGSWWQIPEISPITLAVNY